MRKVVPRQFQRVSLVAGGDKRKACVAIKGPVGIAQFTVHTRGNRCFGQAGADSRSNIGRGRARRNFAHRAVGKRDFQHFRHVIAYGDDSTARQGFAAERMSYGKDA